MNEIIRLCEKLHSNMCTNCGKKGFVKFCLNCGCENINLEDLTYLEVLLKKYKNELVGINELNDVLNALYLLKNYGIDIVDEILKATNYEEIVNSSCNKVNKKYQSKITLTKEEYDLLVCLTSNKLVPKELDFLYNLIVLKGIFNRSYVAKSNEVIIKSFVESMLSKVLNIPDSECTMVEVVGLQRTNINSIGKVCVSKNLAEEINDDNLLTIFETICQEKMRINRLELNNHGKISMYDVAVLKDGILSNFLEHYYETNYRNLLFENEVYINAISEALHMLEVLSINIKGVTVEEAMNIRNIILPKIKNFIRKDESGSSISLDDIFDEFINKNNCYHMRDLNVTISEYVFANNKGIQIEYINDGICIRRRTTIELDELYSRYKDGEIRLTGSKDEIECYFEFLRKQAMNRENFALKRCMME